MNSLGSQESDSGILGNLFMNGQGTVDSSERTDYSTDDTVTITSLLYNTGKNEFQMA